MNTREQLFEIIDKADTDVRIKAITDGIDSKSYINFIVDRLLENGVIVPRNPDKNDCPWCGKLEEKPCHACIIGYSHFACGEGHPAFKMKPYKYCPECGRALNVEEQK